MRRRLSLSPDTSRRLLVRRAQAGAGSSDPMFATSTGTPIEAHNFRRRVFKPAAVRAGVPWATPHMLRHGMASLMAERDYSAAQIAAQLGHADGGALAMRTYIHIQPTETSFVDEAFAEPGR